MATAFQEFSSVYAKFTDNFPDHPLTEEVRRVISRDRFPREPWLRAQTRRMNDLMAPLWLRDTSNS